ncbi:MAG: hypothetical protein DMG27_19080 [Acidobacteria bacterium]|nr:MAG: hypothetical protein DMG27_19080 [Acidobacteriota bacterium]
MDSRLEAALRVWRLVEARRRGLPAFRIFSDRTLRALATSRPVNQPGAARRAGNRDQHLGKIRAGHLQRAARERRLREPSRIRANSRVCSRSLLPIVSPGKSGPNSSARAHA